ncbi:MAG: protein kinase, partial [Planctomycetota bacterium JB042]
MNDTLDDPEDRDEPDDRDELDRLVGRALDRIESGGPSALEELYAERPELADAVEERLRVLGDFGLLEPEPPATPFADEPGRTLGDFRLIRRLGGGGMGVVHLAEQVSLGREVAVKLIRSDQLHHPAARARFQREVDLVARLKHPAIVPIHAVGEVDGAPYFAMERIEGTTLETLLDALRDEDPETFDAGRLPELVARQAGAARDPDWRPAPDWRRFALETARTVARALEHAHRKGVVHRDVKPSNVMIATDGRVFLTDFGLAQAQDDVRLTQSGSVIGSLPYLSPERVRGEPSDERADVYGLGATLYEMWTFRAPYHADSAELLAARIVESPPTSPRRLNRRLTKDDETVVQTALDADLDRRYRGATALAEDLDALLAGTEIRARPLGPLLRLSRLVRRHPGPAAAVVLAFLLFVVAPIAFAAWQIRTNERLTEAFDRALKEQSRAERNLRSAQEAVELILHETASRLLPSVPQMAHARERILESAVEFYLPLLAQEPEDRRSRFELSMMRRSLGDLYLDLGRLDDARIELERLIEMLRALHAEAKAGESGEPSLRELFHQLGAAHAQIAHIDERLGAFDAARSRLEEGIEWFDRANALGDGSPATWLQHALAAASMAQLRYEQGAAGEASDWAERAITSASRARGLDDTGPLAADTLAKALALRARFRYEEGRLAEAVADQRRAIDLVRPLTGEDATITARVSLVTLLQNHGTALGAIGRTEESIAALREAVDRIEPLVAAFPEQSVLLRIAGGAWNSLGLAHGTRGESEESREAYRRSVDAHRRFEATGNGALGPADDFSISLANLASVELSSGGADAAEAILDELDRRLARAPEGPEPPTRTKVREQAAALRARLLIERGDLDAAAVTLRDLLAGDVRDPRVPAACAEIWMVIAELADEPLAGEARRRALQ